MAKKAKTVFVCSECGYESEKWMGKCICGAWNSFVEMKIQDEPEEDSRRRSSSSKNDKTGGAIGSALHAVPQKLSEIKTQSSKRIDTGIGELNRVLGGGLVEGSLTLISGEPGIGKSTIIMQAAANIAENCGTVLYVSGEESEEQIKLRADRICGGATDAGASGLPTGSASCSSAADSSTPCGSAAENSPCDGLDNLLLLSETNMEVVMNLVENMKPKLLIIDSIQTMYSSEIDSIAGSVSQVRACGNLLMNLGKTLGIPVFIVAHVTKSGELAGPKIVEHLVDTVLQFNGERTSDLRILRAVKNRFGTTSEIGAFEMRQEGLAEIENISKTFLDGFDGNIEGAVATASYEGSRPILLEVQGLTASTNIGFARRSSVGFDQNRLAMIIAVLEKKAGINLINRDVYVNIVGGLKPEGTSADLAVALAVWSDEKEIPIPAETLAIGEIGLTGELRPVQNAEKLVKEAIRMGFTTIILPEKNAKALSKIPGSEKLRSVRTLTDAFKVFK